MKNKSAYQRLCDYIESKYGPIIRTKKSSVAGAILKYKKKGPPGDDPSFTK